VSGAGVFNAPGSEHPQRMARLQIRPLTLVQVFNLEGSNIKILKFTLPNEHGTLTFKHHHLKLSLFWN